MKKWTVLRKKLADLKPYSHNPRIAVAEGVVKLTNSLESFGVVRTFVINTDCTIIGGNQMYQVLLAKFGKDYEVDCHVPDSPLSDLELRSLNIKLNKVEAGSWDMELLKAFNDTDTLLEDFKEWELGFSASSFQENTHLIASVQSPTFASTLSHVPTGFSAPSISQSKAIISEEIENQPEVLAENVFIKHGDIVQIVLGNGLIYRFSCFDSTNLQEIGSLMNGKIADMVFQDPPYNLSIAGLGCQTDPKSIANIHDEFQMASGEMTEEEFTNFLTKIFDVSVDYSKDGSIHYNCMDWRHLLEISTAIRKTYTELKNVCVWKKDNAGMGAFYRSKHELVFVTKKGKAKHTNNFLLGQSGRYRTNVWDYPISSSFAAQEREGAYSIGNSNLKLHPTPKPVQMMVDACLDCSQEGEIILDLFAGSGSTAVACLRTNRQCYTNDLEPKYVHRSVKRFLMNCDKNQIAYSVKINNRTFEAKDFA